MRTESKTGYVISGETNKHGNPIYYTAVEVARQNAIEKGLEPLIVETAYEIDIYENRDEIAKAKKDGTFVAGRISAILVR